MKSQIERGKVAKKVKGLWYGLAPSEGKAGLAYGSSIPVPGLVSAEISQACLCFIEKMSAFAKLCHRDNLCPKKAREDTSSKPALGRRPKLEGVSCSAPVFTQPHNPTQLQYLP